MAEEIVRAGFAMLPKAVDEKTRTATHLISTDAIDRVGDMIDATGWDLKNYRRNPIVLMNHDHDVKSIIGAGTVRAGDDGLWATTQFSDIGAGSLAFHLVAEGYARAWSVGFTSQEKHGVAEGARAGCAACKAARKAQLKDVEEDAVYVRGNHYAKQELLEYSLVTVPMNPDAISAYEARGFKREDLDLVVRSIVEPGVDDAPCEAEPAKTVVDRPAIYEALLRAGLVVRQQQTREAIRRIANERTVKWRR
jgi:phage head maturation protease